VSASFASWLAQRRARIAAQPPELAAYQAWLAEQSRGGPRDYLFVEERARFEPRKEDVVARAAELEVAERDGRVFVVSPAAEVALPVEGASAADVRRALAAIDGSRCLLELELDTGPALRAVLRAAFGRLLFAPAAVGALEAQMSGIEITRFPTVPYGIVRAYWENMVAVRAHTPARVPDGLAEFVALLCDLHVIALMGAELDSFYLPASPGSEHGAAPGALWLEAPRLLEGRDGPLMLSGPRVNAALLGGEKYHAALYRSAGDGAALSRSEELHAAGVGWGRVVTARSEREQAPKPFFVPPRPILDAHLSALRTELAAAYEATERDEVVAAAARFHWCFVRLHPFRCANQSLAMNLVGAALSRVLGGSIPHLVLDHLALRLERSAYERVFARAASAFAPVGEGGARLAAARAMNQRAYAFIDAVGRAGDDAACIAADPEGARAALVA
jgi:hypothetical protein